MKRLLAVCLAVAVAGASQAAIILTFDHVLPGDHIPYTGTVARLTLSDVSPGVVQATLEHFSSAADPNRFIAELYLNVAPFVQLSYFGSIPDEISSPVLTKPNPDSWNADGGWYHDAMVDFNQAPPRLTAGKTVAWQMTSSSPFLAGSFAANAVRHDGSPTDVSAVIHLQGIGPGGSDSTWLHATSWVDDQSVPVPEPSTLALIGLAALAGWRRRVRR
ncbi:MAG: PEP-CTERM sorting domain-containing protein [Fimbriimonadaceae bacterium]